MSQCTWKLLSLLTACLALSAAPLAGCGGGDDGDGGIAGSAAGQQAAGASAAGASAGTGEAGAAAAGSGAGAAAAGSGAGTAAAGSGAGAAAAGSGAGETYEYSSCAEEERAGGFQALLQRRTTGDPYTEVAGAVTDGVDPVPGPMLLMADGECGLYQAPDPPDCGEDGCPLGDKCAAGGQCVPEPLRYDVGTVTLEGLVDGPKSMTARAPRNNYALTDSLSYPGFTEGAALTLVNDAESPSLNLRALGVAELNLPQPEVQVASGSATMVTWDPPAEAGHSRVLAKLEISLHGGDPVHIACDAEDDGSLEISAALITELLSFSYSGFPAIGVTRQTADSTQGPDGCIDFRVGSQVSRHPVEIEGLISCNPLEGLDCPTGQTCDEELLLCR